MGEDVAAVDKLYSAYIIIDIGAGVWCGDSDYRKRKEGLIYVPWIRSP